MAQNSNDPVVEIFAWLFSLSGSIYVFLNCELLLKTFLLVSSNQKASINNDANSGNISITEPLITIITVVFNGGRYLQQVIDSVKGQSYENIQYIIIDGGSNDDSVEILKENDAFIDLWVSEPDSGIYDAMNKGVQKARGDYILFLGADDQLLDVVHNVITYFDDSSTCYYGNVKLSSDSQIYDGEFNFIKLFYKNIPHQAIFYPKLVFEEYRYDSKFKIVADYALNLKLYADHRFHFKYMPFTISVYNDVDGISSHSQDSLFAQEKPVLIKKSYHAFYYWIYLSLRYIYKYISPVFKK